MGISGINHVTLSVNDLSISFDFYRNVLGLKPLALRRNSSAYFLAGDDWIALVQARTEAPISPLYSHLALTISDSDYEALSHRILSSGAKVWQENSTPGKSLYFLDPSGNKLEIHTGNWESRLHWLLQNPSSEVELFL